ncbi:hypothetical protein IEQ34_005279 [Dendrobium chrysotoxum]|uniref:Uncharacterized protein n=1 Tax=Dendrobium chrysotoxum TaxID=161865 RepID=A0AAV7H8F1_DENCH|nr:hypothetical protein IEQ34_005279 [Dendrobium chrysotoxum]
MQRSFSDDSLVGSTTISSINFSLSFLSSVSTGAWGAAAVAEAKKDNDELDLRGVTLEVAVAIDRRESAWMKPPGQKSLPKSTEELSAEELSNQHRNARLKCRSTKSPSTVAKASWTDSVITSFVPSITFHFGSDTRVTLLESLLEESLMVPSPTQPLSLLAGQPLLRLPPFLLPRGEVVQPCAPSDI